MSGSQQLTLRMSAGRTRAASAESAEAGAVSAEHTKTVDLLAYLDAEGVERAAGESNAWIKSLRTADVDGVPFRDRFTYRGDSLWWFAEIFLHRQDVITRLWRVTLALEALCAREREQLVGIRYPARDPLLALLVPQVAERHGIAHEPDRAAGAAGGAQAGAYRLRLAETDLKSRLYTWSAFASRLLPRPAYTRAPRRAQPAQVPKVAHESRDTREAPDTHAATAAASPTSAQSEPSPPNDGGTLAFVHSAFWKTGRQDDGEEGYIGAVLRDLQQRGEAQPVRLVGVGPQTNFKARRWWHPLTRRGRTQPAAWPIVPVERFASWRQLAGSRGIWRERKAIERALLASAALRERSRVLGYDVWPIVREELRGVARLQFTWSARAMDEAAAAMDAYQPARVLTYAEAGGWGRAIMLEARRRGIPSVGLQHGFIYRHWLNYVHAPDEMQPSAVNPSDAGFPRPDLTLVYDGYAAGYLRDAGQFPAGALRVTGSPGLDALVSAVARVTDEDRARVREVLGASPGEAFAVIVSKYSQIRDALPALVRAAGALAGTEGLRLIVKPHPAETAQPYVTGPHMLDAAGAARVTVAPPALDLASLLAAAQLVITVNSTVAIDAMTLGLPSLIVLLPNNLSPFVDAGAMAGASDLAALPDLLRALTQDAALRQALLDRAREFLAAHQIASSGRSSAAAVDAILAARR
jgi:hypothetical protein